MRDFNLENSINLKIHQLKLFQKAGVIEIILRIKGQEMLKSLPYRLYGMHPETVHHVFRLLIENGIVIERIEGRKKIMSLSTKGNRIAILLESIVSEMHSNKQ